MLFSVVVVFLVCSVDYLVLDILSYLQIPYNEFWDSLGNFLLSLNSALNFIIYCAFGKKFRREFFLFLNEISKGALCKKERLAVVSGSRGASNSLAVSGGLHVIQSKHSYFNALFSLLYFSYAVNIRIFRAFLLFPGAKSIQHTKESVVAVATSSL